VALAYENKISTTEATVPRPISIASAIQAFKMAVITRIFITEHYFCAAEEVKILLLMAGRMFNSKYFS
jgi:hypothetical protein